MSKKNKKTISYNNIFKDLDKLDKILEDLQSITTVNKISIEKDHNNIKSITKKLAPISKEFQNKYKKFIPKKDLDSKK